MVKRGLTREAFGKKLDPARRQHRRSSPSARCEIEAMRLMVLKAAKAMDVLGNKEARVWVSDGQGDGARARLPDHRPGDPDARRHRHLAVVAARRMYQDVRHLRFADGPDEVHWMVVGRHELSMT
jgi:acyl-CoA dehydrogenase